MVEKGKAAFTDESILDKSEFNNGKLDSSNPLAQPPIQQPENTTIVLCPSCGSRKVWKDGLRYSRSNRDPAQRFLCRKCGYRFSERKPLQKNPSWQINTESALFSKRQVCEFLTEDSKNLAISETRIQEKAQRGANATDSATIKGKIIEFLWWMEKEGFAKDTIRGYGSCLRALLQRNADLLDPESVKEALAKETRWSQNRRRNVINAYTLFLRFNGSRWEKPRCKVDRKIPFIPTEQEIDCLIAGNPKKVATFLQLLKETAFRSGEAKRLLWIDIDFEKRLITLNQPEKNSLPGIYKVSQKLIDMLNALPRKSLKIFGDGPINSIKVTFIKARRRLAHKLQNPRLLQIHFHTLRHWKATMEYHRTKDVFHVKEFLRHKKLENIAIYVQIDERLFKDSDEGFTCRIAHNTGEAISLIEVGFEYVTGEYGDGGKLFRKRK